MGGERQSLAGPRFKPEKRAIWCARNCYHGNAGCIRTHKFMYAVRTYTKATQCACPKLGRVRVLFCPASDPKRPGSTKGLIGQESYHRREM